MKRWQKILEQSYQQSGRAQELHIREGTTLSEVLKKVNLNDFCFGLFAYEGSSSLKVSEALETMTRGHREVWLFVGSEGGFSQSEVELFKAHGLPPTSLGSQVLRVETACITLVSILKYRRECIDERKF